MYVGGKYIHFMTANTFPLFLYVPSLQDSGVLMIYQEKITSSKTSFEIACYGMAWS
jgi:hypothetical protein